MDTAEKIYEIGRLEDLARKYDQRAETARDFIEQEEDRQTADSYRARANVIREDLV